nr:hypothetical protein [Tanacetum cinerariifolium]
MLTYRLSLSDNSDDVDQFSDSSIRKNTVSPQQGADTGGGNVMTHLFAKRADLVYVTTVPISRIFDRLRHMCLDTRGSDYVNNLGNSYRQILHQNESTQRADKQLVSHTRAHVFETVSLHTQSDMLGHTPSSSLVASLNHAYLCMDVTEHTIRPQIIFFSDGSLKDDSKTALTRSLSPSLPFHAHLPPLTLWQRCSIRQNTVAPQQGADTGGGNVMTHLFARRVDLVYATAVPILRIFDHLRHMCLDTYGSDCVNNSDMLGHMPSSSLVASLNHAYLCMDVTEHTIRPQIISFSDGSLKDDSKTAPTRSLSPSLPFHAHLPPLTLQKWRRLISWVFSLLLAGDNLSSLMIVPYAKIQFLLNKILHQNESAQRADRQLVSHTRVHVSERVSLHTQSDMLGHTPSSSLVAPLNHAYLCMDVTEHIVIPQIISFSDGSLKDDSKTAPTRFLSPSFPFHAHLPPLTLRQRWQLVSHTRAHVSETMSLHTQSDMLGHTPSSSLVAPLNHAYLCMDVTKHTIRPQIISFSDNSLKDGSKTATNQRSTFSSRTAGDSRARLVANSEESLVNPCVTTPPDPEDEPIEEEPLEEPKEEGEIRYHSRNANVVTDALSRKERAKPRQVENATTEMLRCLDQLIEMKEDGGMYFIWVPLIDDLRTLIMDEDHASRLSRSGNGYDTNWVIVDRLTKLAYFLAIKEDYKMEKLARLYIDEIVAGHEVPVSIILDRDGRFTSRDTVLWDEIRESRLIRPELVQETTDKVVLIKKKLKAVRKRQKSYADNRRKLLEFEVKDQVLLKVSPWKADANLHVHLEEIKEDKTLCFVEEPVEIIDREVKSLKRSRISIVKVHWNSKRGHEDFIKTKYLHLLVEQAIVGST